MAEKETPSNETPLEIGADRPTRAERTLTEKGQLYKKELKEKELIKTRESLIKLLNTLEEATNEPNPDLSFLTESLEEINKKQRLHNEAHAEALPNVDEPGNLVTSFHSLELACATIRNKIISLTQGAIPKTRPTPSISHSNASRTSRASSMAKASVAALKQQVLEEQERQEREEEIRRLKVAAEETEKEHQNKLEKMRAQMSEQLQVSRMNFEIQQRKLQRQIEEQRQRDQRQIEEEIREKERDLRMHEIESQLRVEMVREKIERAFAL